MAKIIRITAEEADRRLKDVPEDKRFWCSDGRVIKNLEELGTALGNMSDETFGYHTGERGNDFSKWIKDVIGDDTLANQLQKATTRETAARLVKKRVEWLKAKI